MDKLNGPDQQSLKLPATSVQFRPEPNRHLIRWGPKRIKLQDSFRNKNTKCDYFDRGYSKYGESCNNEHPDIVCVDANCFDDKCPARHPNPCKYGPRCHYNKKYKCYYSHLTLAQDVDKKRIVELEKKVNNLEK